MGISQTNFKQNVQVEVVRASSNISTEEYLKKPVVCQICKNYRFWLVRCEYCGFYEEILGEENNE
jgi:hypothetical protein